MKIRINDQKIPEQLREILIELSREANIELSIDGTILLAEQNKVNKGFIVKKEADRIHITYQSCIDFCRALLSCSQLEDGQTCVGTCAFREFGVMLDISRNAVYRVETLKKMVRLCALMGYTFLGIYMEDTMLVKKEPYLGYMRGALTSAEIKELDRYCIKFGMELRPYIQTLAHFNQLTRYEEYQKFIDCDDIFMVGDKRTYELIDHIFGTLAENFTTRKVNIGMDEAHMVGLGRYLEQNGYHDRVGIMSEHLKKVLSISEHYGFHAQMWSDMFFRLAYGEYYAEGDDSMFHVEIPDNIELIYWDYYSQEEKHYEKMLKKHLKLTTKVGFAGGAWKWTGFSPHNRYGIRCGQVALKACMDNKIESVVITAWGDNGAEASPFSILPTLYEDSVVAYQSSLQDNAFLYLTGLSIDQFMKLDLPNPFQESGITNNDSGKYLLYNDILLGTFDTIVTDAMIRSFLNAKELLKDINKGSNYQYIFNTQTSLCEVLCIKADIGNRLKEAYDQSDYDTLHLLEKQEFPELLKRLEKLYEDFKYQWEIESKPFGFEIQCIRFGGLIQRIRYALEKLKEYLNGKRSGIEELDEKRLPFAYCRQEELEEVGYNHWSKIVSPSVIG